MKKNLIIKLFDVLTFILLFPFLILVFIYFAIDRRNIIGYIRSDFIGHYLVSIFVNDASVTSKNNNYFYFLSYPNKVNKYLLKYTKEHLNIKISFLVKYLYFINKITYFDILNTYNLDYDTANYIDNIKEKKYSFIFSEYENKIGHSFLKKINFENKRYVVILNRDEAYKNRYHYYADTDWSYHNFRNSDISNYKEAILWLLKKGYGVLRLGKIYNKHLDIDHQSYFDYSLYENKSDFLDIWLIYNCFFCISSATGLDQVRNITNKPILYVNRIPIVDIISNTENNYFIPKKIFSNNLNRLLTLEEIFLHKFAGFKKSNDYKNNNLSIIENSSDELLDATIEFEELLDTKVLKNYDNELQLKFYNKFTSLLKASNYDINKNYNFESFPKISNSFIKKNKKWFLENKT